MRKHRVGSSPTSGTANLQGKLNIATLRSFTALSRLTPYLTPYRKGNHEKGKGRRVRLQEEGQSLAGQILGRWQEEVNLR